MTDYDYDYDYDSPLCLTPSSCCPGPGSLRLHPAAGRSADPLLLHRAGGAMPPEAHRPHWQVVAMVQGSVVQFLLQALVLPTLRCRGDVWRQSSGDTCPRSCEKPPWSGYKPPRSRDHHSPSPACVEPPASVPVPGPPPLPDPGREVLPPPRPGRAAQLPGRHEVLTCSMVNSQ
jgi:hypothetical protein